MRTRPHILEEKSKQAFRKAIPDEWVVREQSPDYGLDIQVQIFIGGMPTQFYFFVQLKGTDTISEKTKQVSYNFETKHLIQYIDNPLPVMLVLYDSQGNRLFYEWVAKVLEPLSIETRRKLHVQKYMSIPFTHRLDTLKTSILESEVKHQCYRQGTYQYQVPKEFIISLKISLPRNLPADLRRKISIWLDSSTDSRLIKISESPSPDATITLKQKPLLLVFSCGDKSATIKLKKSLKETTFPDDIISTLKITIAMVLSGSGLLDLALNLIKRAVFENLPLSSEARLMLYSPGLSWLYASTNRISEALDIAEELLKKGYLSCALNIASAAIANASCPKFHYQKYRHFLKAAIEAINDKREKAGLHYNLANNLRRESYFKEAIHHYHQAALNDATYRERSYWWAELAGCLFLCNKLRWSEKCYRKAIRLGEKLYPVQALLGDVLLYRGKFKESRIEFDKYLRKTKKPIAEFFLKRWLSCYLERTFGDTNRDKARALELTDYAIKGKRYKKLLEAIKTDPLCGLAWYNYAVYQNKNKRDERYWEWLIASILQDWNIEAWTNTILLIMFEKTKPAALIIMAATYEAFRLHGASLEKELLGRFPSMSREKREELLKDISNIRKSASLSEFSLAQEEPTIRRYIKTGAMPGPKV